MSSKLVLVLAVVALTHADPSAVDVLHDIYNTCLKDFSVSCAKPKALAWMSYVADKPEIKVTEDLVIVKKKSLEEERGAPEDIFDKFEDFLQSHDVVAKVPQVLQPGGFLGGLVPRSLQPEEVKVPLAVTGRSKIVKKVIVPFLLGLKFKTAVLVPLALALIALKTWKALTLGLLSLVLTGALLIFKLSKPKINYEVVHFPHHHDHHVDHIVDHHEHHLDHPPAAGWDHPGYGRELSAQEMAYNAYL
ncbi:uncharacterized protein LOC123015675 [Tribolium madens]|uniref:uncharacterized protein LOC123015675 n=1 Tax=Tribolium madens TaxID=41895 RepID=UPI001CF72224|nr:uncharacterized protein LOC123015675 [Tribolium madens]